MKSWQVKQVGHNLVWHIRLAAIAFEHCVDSYGVIFEQDPDASVDVRNEHVKAMNAISGMGEDLITIGRLLRHEVDGGFQGAAQSLIKKCDVALEDLKVIPLMEYLKEQAREAKQAASEKGEG